MYTLNVCNLLYVDCTVVKLFKYLFKCFLQFNKNGFQSRAEA